MSFMIFLEVYKPFGFLWTLILFNTINGDGALADNRKEQARTESKSAQRMSNASILFTLT